MPKRGTDALGAGSSATHAALFAPVDWDEVVEGDARSSDGSSEATAEAGDVGAARYPPPKWEAVTVDGKRKRRCLWATEPDGPVCGKCVGATKHQIERHWRGHTGEKPYQCRMGCNEAFVEPGHRDIHERRKHTKEKPFQCRHCNETFATSDNRNKHERVHTGEKPYPCRMGCDKAFVTSSELKDHERRKHTKEKPYKCKRKGCKKAFASWSDRNKHERLHRGERTDPCKGGKKGVCDGNRNGVSKYDGHCVRCFIDKFENDPRAVNAKAYLHAKEQTVRLFLEKTFPEYRWTFDRSHAVGVLVRPDAKAVLGRTRLLIVEIDEHSHNTYDCAKEREREAILAKHAPKGAVIHLIRINPDAYDDPVTGERVPSCFRYSKVEGLVTVDPARQADWDARLAKLKAVIDEIVAHKHEAIAVPECLFVDDRYGHVIPIELFYDNVREKWPDGNKQRRAALKRNAKVRKLLAEGVTPPPLAQESAAESDEESD